MDIRNIWAVGRNYSEHAKEMGASVPKEPLVFLKAGSCAVPNGTSLKLPSFSSDVHHELELAFQFDDRLTLSNLTLAIDLTARDVQSKAKREGGPWTLSKSFKEAAALGTWSRCWNVDSKFEFQLKVNGSIRQTGNSMDMIFKPSFLADYVCKYFPVCPGDVLLTGTPVGVAAIHRGDSLEAFLDGTLVGTWKAI